MFKKIKAAKERLWGHSNITPIMTSRTLDRLSGAKIYLKCENFQRSGSFKFRGAFNAISLLSKAQREHGVLTYSSGNHAQAAALVGQLLKTHITVVMPENAPKIKRDAVKAYGADIIYYNPEKATREEIAKALAAEHQYAIVPPYDHEDIVAGQGTAAMEMLEKLKTLDMLLVPCGGGGLLSGSAIAAKNMARNCKVIGIEPELANDAALSFHTKKLHTIKNPPTIADGTRTPSLGKVTFPLVLQYVDDMKTVSENAIIEAVRFLFFRMKLVVEPSGALGIAALLSGAVTPDGRVGVIISGGNIDAAIMTAILENYRCS